MGRPKKEEVYENPFFESNDEFETVRNMEFTRLKSLRPDGSSKHTKLDGYEKVTIKRQFSMLIMNPRWSEIFYKCSPAGRDMLLYVLMHIKYKSGIVEINPEEVSKEASSYVDTSDGRSTFSIRKIYSGIENLVSMNILVKKSPKQYWVNPFFIFKGSLIEYFEQSNVGALKLRRVGWNETDNGEVDLTRDFEIGTKNVK